MSLEPSIGSETSMPTTAVFDLNVLRQFESELATVQVIVETFQAGTYGQCIACGVGIDRDLLRADPLRVTCPPHEGQVSLADTASVAEE